MSDVVLIKANNQKKLYQGLSEDLSGIEPPLWIILLAAYLRDKGIAVSVVDAEAENLDAQETIKKVREINPRLASVVVSGTNPSASTTNMTGAGEFLKEFSKSVPEIPTAICGLHPSALPEQTTREEAVDFVMEGEGFTTHEELIKAFKEGKSKKDELNIKGLWYKRGDDIVSNPRPENIQDLGTLPMPAWDLLPMEKYRAHNWHCFDHIDQRTPYAVVYTSLGCPYNCSFCCIHAIFGGVGIRFRPIDDIVEEIDYLVKKYGVKNIKILDEIFVLKPQRVDEFCEKVSALGHDLNFWVYGRIDTVKKDMVEKMKRAGINWLAYGIEAGSKKVRDGVSKGRFDQDKIKEVVKFTHEAGISIVANFIFGLPDDDFETMQETLDLAKELNCAYTNLYCTMAYPGSQLYSDAVAQKIPLPQSWSGYAQFSEGTLPLPTKHLTSGQVLRFRDNAFHEYHEDPKYLNMIGEKFGDQVVEHIKRMCSVRLKRKNYDQDEKKFLHAKS